MRYPLKTTESNFSFVFNAFFILIIFIFTSAAQTQDLSGLVSDRWSGINRHIPNPSAVWTSHGCAHFSLITGNGGFDNNLFYLQGSEFIPRNNVGYMNGHQYGRIHGPSVLWKRENQYFGISNAVRTVSHIDNVPAHLASFIKEGFSYLPYQNQFFDEIQPFAIGSLSWAELSFTYATLLRRNIRRDIIAGVTVKPLFGLHGIMAGSDEISYIVNSNRDLTVYNMDFYSRGAVPVNYRSFQFNGVQNSILGFGFSFDVGFTWINKREEDHYRRAEDLRFKNGIEEYYDWAWGFSLIDAGAFNLTRNTRGVEFTNARLFIPGVNLEDYAGPASIVDEMEARLLSGSLVREEDENYWFFLPTAFSSQFDYYHGRRLYSYLYWVHDIPLVENRISRPSVIGYTPRYESPLFTLALPVTLYDYKKPRVGIAMRIGFLTIGSDRPGALLGIGELDESDVYFSIHWTFKCSRRIKACIER
jgi:hypothetical protein